ncbi:YigZ family protein [Lysinibacillus sp. HST-98]|uniref:YigZ family protein n=1 Tax=Lysinibacillus capsici TaxID=2115968 RepID=A0ABY8KDP6_9BACI|nr:MULTISPECIES: YigZ family protein [Lysinibacillus]MBL3730204.1 YigZ family protein [Lysinibacillus sp. HST-98]MCM0626361.1 YigZ family protein [Lysinibacillus sp. OL1_EC]MCS5503242.1 YigZ family protein [Lysinibacillus sp. A4]MDP1393446.1 YigZ family protein [Lysinibacillus capsici]MDP1413920.1 YigZ family protein [Lysinibacillus capsici]
MRENYLTVKGYGESEIVISKSRFLTYIERAETEEDAISFIDGIKKLHHNATHNCSAYIIGEHDHIQKANDDGEPSGTAGVPMLEVLKKQGLKDTVVVVTRYFGGIKLGGGGLIRAYGKATTEGLIAAQIVERKLHHFMKVAIDYTWLGKVENEIRSSSYSLEEIRYLEGVEIIVSVLKEDEEQFRSWITEMTNGQASITFEDAQFVEFIVN